MQDYLVPTNDTFIEHIAKSIARSRMFSEASSDLFESTGIKLADGDPLEATFDHVFDTLWNDRSPTSEVQKSLYRRDAAAAIRAINLKLLTTIT